MSRQEEGSEERVLVVLSGRLARRLLAHQADVARGVGDPRVGVVDGDAVRPRRAHALDVGAHGVEDVPPVGAWVDAGVQGEGLRRLPSEEALDCPPC